MINDEMFKGRTLFIATKHEKEKVISPLLEKELGVKCIISSKFYTDLLGTFTGEIERKEGSIKTRRNKCLLAMELNNLDLGIASEGSFGSHPYIPFSYADEEFLIFIDKKSELAIIERELSTHTDLLIELLTRKKYLGLTLKSSSRLFSSFLYCIYLYRIPLGIRDI